MEEYYIYKINPNFLTFSLKYPKTIHFIARKEPSEFDDKQRNLIFQDHSELNEQLKKVFIQRNDYTYKKNTHYIRNKFTGAYSFVRIYDHAIYLKCSSNFHIMKNIILQCDSNYVILDK